MVGRLRMGTDPARPAPWQNWPGTARPPPCTGEAAQRSEISAAVKVAAAAGLTVRALGSGHSFTAHRGDLRRGARPVRAGPGSPRADTGTGLVTVRSGTPLRRFNAELSGLGLAMANLGDIDVQTSPARSPPGRTAPAPGSAAWPPRSGLWSWCWPTARWCTCSASSAARAVRRRAGRPGRPRRDHHRDAALRAGVHAAGRRAPDAGGRDPRRSSTSWPRPTTTSSSTGSPTATGPGQAEQPADRRALTPAPLSPAAVLGVRGDGERRLRRSSATSAGLPPVIPP